MELLPIEVAAEYVSTDVETLRHHVNLGTIAAQGIGEDLRFRMDDLDNWGYVTRMGNSFKLEAIVSPYEVVFIGANDVRIKRPLTLRMFAQLAAAGTINDE